MLGSVLRVSFVDIPSTCTSSLSRCSGPVGEAELEINIPIEEEELEICLPIEEEELEICLRIEEEELEICLPIEEEELEICLPIEEDKDEERDTCLKNQQEHNILPAKRRASCVKEILKRTE